MAITWKHLSLAAIIVCTGCMKNPYVDFYRDSTGGTDLVEKKVIAKNVVEPTVSDGGSNAEADWFLMRSEGFLLLGYSSFSGTNNVDWHQSMDQARRVNATVVRTFRPNYTGTKSGVMPLTIPTSQTTYSTGNATAYGSGGSVNVYGSGTSTTYGSQVMAVPYSVDRYDYLATFWAKDIRPVVFGVEWRDLTDAERSGLGTNKGARIHVVIKDSPAFRGDFMRNDIVLKINGEDVYGARSAQETAAKHAGETVSIELVRAGAAKTITLRLNSKP